MKPKYKNGNGELCAIIRINFTVLFSDIIFATSLLLKNNKEVTIYSIKQQLKQVLKNSGEDYNIDGYEGYEIEQQHEEKAAIIAKKLFPLWAK